MKSIAVGELKGKFGYELNCGCGNPAWRMEYSEFLLGLKKPEARHKKCDGCSLGKGVFEDHIHLLFRAAFPRVGRAMLARSAALKTEFPNACMHGLQNVLKKETGLYKMGGVLLRAENKFFFWAKYR